jgi:NADPH-dependent 2,4-dienoyl-CoA reductase/sulfur reductase-like enzyme
VVKIFEMPAPRTGIRDGETTASGFDRRTISHGADDLKSHYPGSHRIAMRYTGDRGTGWLLGVQFFGHRLSEIAERIDIASVAIFHGMTVEGMNDLDLSYTPPLGSPWDAAQMGAQAWVRDTAG